MKPIEKTAARKTWTAPVIKSIDLNSAKNGVLQHSDGPATGKS